ncbi:hypothetical protein, partial [Nocardia brasiliensis]|uniref:hypothetical protein n=1 Tax=Nocardia brasiliensis TaxID=37326 RepID=UPI0024543C49
MTESATSARQLPRGGGGAAPARGGGTRLPAPEKIKKPANILVTAGDHAYLADFGIAHTQGD